MMVQVMITVTGNPTSLVLSIQYDASWFFERSRNIVFEVNGVEQSVSVNVDGNNLLTHSIKLANLATRV